MNIDGALTRPCPRRNLEPLITPPRVYGHGGGGEGTPLGGPAPCSISVVFLHRRFTSCIHRRFMYSSRYVFTVVNEVRALQ